MIYNQCRLLREQIDDAMATPLLALATIQIAAKFDTVILHIAMI